MAWKLGYEKSFELATKIAYGNTLANVQRKGVPNGGSGYCETSRTETCADARDRQSHREQISQMNAEHKMEHNANVFQFSLVQLIDSMQQLHDRMIAQIRTWWKRTKRHQSALTIALKDWRLSYTVTYFALRMYVFFPIIQCFTLISWPNSPYHHRHTVYKQ